jgi:hypothetical protein
VLGPDGSEVVSLQGFSDTSGDALLQWKTSRREAPGSYTAEVREVINTGYEFDAGASAPPVTFVIQ